MEQVDVIAVVGACAPERRWYARRLAAETDRMLLPASRLERSPSPAREAAELARWSDRPAGAVIEFPVEVQTTELVAALGDPAGPARLLDVICVADAAHLYGDLSADDFLVSERDALGRPSDWIARAALTVTQLEYASTVVLVGWDALPTPQLSTAMALVSMLSPGARLRLHQGSVGNDVAPATPGACDGDRGRHRPGWVRVLNGDCEPHMRDRHVGALRYEQLRPFHPGRLSELLMRRFDTDEFGWIVRSAGFCRLASRPDHPLHWDQAGGAIAFHLAHDAHRAHPADRADHADGHGHAARDDPAAGGQELAFIGIDLDSEGLAGALDDAVLDDAEFTAGPAAWRALPDPFPAWDGAELPE